MNRSNLVFHTFSSCISDSVLLLLTLFQRTKTKVVLFLWWVWKPKIGNCCNFVFHYIFLSRSYHLGTLVKYLCPWYPQLCYHVWKFVWWSLVCIVYGPSMRFKDWKRSRITNWIRIVKLCMWYKKKHPWEFRITEYRFA